jgi:transposase-like protein
MEFAAPIKWHQLNPILADEDKARLYLEHLRWGANGAACPHCGVTEVYKLNSAKTSSTRKGVWKCRTCKKQFTVTVGTVFESSHIHITKWLQALYLITASKKGISAHQLHRMLGITYKSAWFMAHRLRYAMSDGPLASNRPHKRKRGVSSAPLIRFQRTPTGWFRRTTALPPRSMGPASRSVKPHKRASIRKRTFIIRRGYESPFSVKREG